MKQLFIFSALLLLLSACEFTKRVSWIRVKNIHPAKTISLQSDEDSSFYMQFDRAAYLKFIESDTSIQKEISAIKQIVETNELDINIDTVFTRISGLFNNHDFNRNIVYDDFVERQLNKGRVIVVNKNNKRMKKWMRRTTYYYHHEKLRAAYSFGKTVFYGDQFMIVDF